jgi:hypothetical protein
MSKSIRPYCKAQTQQQWRADAPKKREGAQKQLRGGKRIKIGMLKQRDNPKPESLQRQLFKVTTPHTPLPSIPPTPILKPGRRLKDNEEKPPERPIWSYIPSTADSALCISLRPWCCSSAPVITSHRSIVGSSLSLPSCSLVLSIKRQVAGDMGHGDTTVSNFDHSFSWCLDGYIREFFPFSNNTYNTPNSDSSGYGLVYPTDLHLRATLEMMDDVVDRCCCTAAVVLGYSAA